MLIVLDRDGVINYDSPNHIRSPKEWNALPHSLQAISRLNHAGHRVVVATNQSGIGRGYHSLESLEAIHQKMREELALVGGHVDGIYYCPHQPDDECECRKPKPGMLFQVVKDFSEDLKQVYVVGDSFRDLQAGWAAGTKVILVRTGNGEKTLTENEEALSDTPIYDDLSAAVGAILKGTIL